MLPERASGLTKCSHYINTLTLHRTISKAAIPRQTIPKAVILLTVSHQTILMDDSLRKPKRWRRNLAVVYRIVQEILSGLVSRFEIWIRASIQMAASWLAPSDRNRMRLVLPPSQIFSLRSFSSIAETSFTSMRVHDPRKTQK